MDTDQQIMSLMLAAQDQQESINKTMDELQPLLQALEKTCGNLAYERKELSATISSIRESCSSFDSEARKITNTYSESLPQFKLQVTRGVNEAVSEHLNNISTSADKIASTGLNSLLEKIQSTSRQVEVATHNLSMKYFLLIVFSVAAITVSSLFVISWQEKSGLSQDINNLRQEKAALNSNLANLILIGASANIIDCTDTAKRARKCVEVSSNPEIITNGNRTYVMVRGR